MDFENEKKTEETPKDGFQNEQREFRPGRSPRPRIHTGQRPAYERPTYNHDNDEGGFRPEGFGAGPQSSTPQRPSFRPRQGGYQQRASEYGQEPRSGYQSRQPREGGYQPRQQRPSYGAPRQGGYQSREGGYQQRGSEYGQEPRGGYQPRQPREGGYGQRPSYGAPRQGGYNAQGGGSNKYNKQGRAPYGAPAPYNKKKHTPGYDPNAKYSMKKRIEYKEVNYDPNEPLRLNKYLANAGVCSRREADEFIQAGVVTVNGQVVTELGTKILRTDEVRFHDQPVTIEKKVYVLLNKPKDYVTTSDDPQQRKTVMDLVKNACPERIYPVGRLDRNTTGVLLLTNDGDMASKLTHPKYLKKKIYHVFLDKACSAHDLQQIAEGIQLEDGEIKADDVQYAHPTDKKQVGIEIHSGKNRIVRRIFESLGYRVQKLDRVQFAGLTKKNLKRGDWRYLTEEEVDRLRMGAYE